jgi:tRNA (cmo5U34)-methyltransferase
MAHSVEQHLSVSPAAYDVEIRRFIPDYDAMIDEVAEAVAEHAGAAPHVIDLGAGTGSLTEQLARRLPAARFTLIDIDPAMLAQAATRLAAVRERVTAREASFDDPLPPCDAVVAGLAVHHVHDPAAKQALFARVREALRPGGVLVIADAMIADAGPFAAPVRARWAAHMVARGDSEAQAYARFAEWAEEDRYFPIADELARLAAAGFAAVDVRWRQGPMAVVVAVA